MPIQFGPCAKTTVRCTLILADGTRVHGTNACRNPQTVCPRAPGEGYDKCKTVCAQDGHAETQALAFARDMDLSVVGARAFFTGNTYACRDCQEALYDAGIVSITRGPAPEDTALSIESQDLADRVYSLIRDLQTVIDVQRSYMDVMAHREKNIAPGHG